MADLKFIVELQDKVSAIADKVNNAINHTKTKLNETSSAAEKLGPKINSAFTGVYQKAKTAVKGPDVLANSIDDLRVKLEKVNNVRFNTVLTSEFKSATKEAKALERQISRLEKGISNAGIGGKIASWRSDFANSMPGAEFIKNPLTLAGAAVGGFWMAANKAMGAGKEKMKLQVLSGLKEIGTTLYDGLTKFATDTVFGDELYDMAGQMMASGIKNADVLPIMKELGDISMGDANKLGSLSLAFAQVQGKGHLAGQELNQLINAGFNPLQVISEQTGESMGALRKRMEEGEITVEAVRGAMQRATGEGGKFHNMLDGVANTPYGQLENIRGELSQLAIQIGSVFIPIISKLMQAFLQLNEKVGPAIKPIAIGIGILSVSILGLAAAQWVMTTAIWANTAALLANPITWVVVAVAALVAAIVAVIQKYHEWGAAILLLLGPLGFVINAVMALYNNWESIKEAFSSGGIIAGLKRIGLVLLDAVLYPVQQLLTLLAKIPGLTDIATSGIEKIANIRNNLNLIDPKAPAEKVEAKNSFTQQELLMQNITAGGNAMGKNAPEASKTNKAIATGGTRNTTINLNLRNIIENSNISKSGFKESVQELETQAVDGLLRALAMANLAAE
ncbi:tape measure protein [Brumimicrobium mesophilum]|uniref:tape measure protein n=1 Tax=Brumimicrobium mesophilum TaxID=392717 RepID=UPI000D14007D|nr:tape measure protein [Brumimicrobium mesophilum]